MIKKMDILVIVILLILSLSLFLFIKKEEVGVCIVYYQNEVIDILYLDEDNLIEYVVNSGSIKILVENKEVRIISSPCNHKTCVKMPPIKYNNETIICLPLHFRLLLVSDDEVDIVI